MDTENKEVPAFLLEMLREMQAEVEQLNVRLTAIEQRVAAIEKGYRRRVRRHRLNVAGVLLLISSIPTVFAWYVGWFGG